MRIKDQDSCARQQQHAHIHGPHCGHSSVQHDDHIDYLHDGHFHRVHGDHVDDCPGPQKQAES